jgi:hypothetical protein
MKDLDSKVAVVTGAGSGIGRALALALATAGSSVAVCDLNGAAAADVADEIRHTGGSATAFEVDVSDEKRMRTLVEDVLARYTLVDIVVNNAGIGSAPRPTAQTSFAAFRRTLEVNLWGAIHGSGLFIPHLLARPAANLVNVASFAGLMGMTGLTPYTTSKFGVRGLTEALQMEFHRGPLTVSLVYPGGTRTPLMMNSPVIEESKKDAMNRSLMTSAQAKTPAYVAARIVKGIRADKARILVGPDTRVIDKIVRAAPERYPTLMAPVLAAMLRKSLGA